MTDDAGRVLAVDLGGTNIRVTDIICQCSNGMVCLLSSTHSNI